MKNEEQLIKDIEREIDEIETAMACDDSISPFSLAFAQASDRLDYLRRYLNKLKK
jgi:hypothetical protein